MTDADMLRYEGLVKKTAALYDKKVDDDYDDLCQVFRIRVWRALEAFDASRSTNEKGFVFSCVVNQGKDLLQAQNTRDRNGTNPSYIEDIIGGDFDGGGGRGDREELFEMATFEATFEALESELAVESLEPDERRIVCMLYAGYSQIEVRAKLDYSKRKMEAAIATVRKKMQPAAFATGC